MDQDQALQASRADSDSSQQGLAVALQRDVTERALGTIETMANKHAVARLGEWVAHKNGFVE